jgi:hypothetical protein
MIETFMWGYWGWGGSTRELLQSFDAAEAERGYEPPLFVDARVSRQVRAVGFRGDAFETLLGGDRHRWIRGLGNRAILEGGTMELLDASAVAELLDLVIESHRERRRVLFFCACEGPRVDGRRHCHRDLIGELLVKEARRRRIELSVVEWPGGAPRRLSVAFPPKTLRANAVSSVPMPKKMSVPIGVALPWGSYAMAEGGVAVVVGPAIHRQGRWSLQILMIPQAVSTELQLQRAILTQREEGGYEPRFSPASAGPLTAPWEELVVDVKPAARRGRDTSR